MRYKDGTVYDLTNDQQCNLADIDVTTDARKLVSLMAVHDLPSETIKLLTQHPAVEVRQSLPQQKNISKEILQILSKDTNELVLYYVAKNPKTPIETLKKLSKTQNITVKTRIEFTREELLTQHIKTLPSVLQKQAQVLAPTFSGWPDDLNQVLHNLNHLPIKQNQQGR